MKSNNPVFNRSPEFNGQATNAYGNQTYPGNGTTYPGYGQQGYSDPSTWGTGTPGTPTQVDQGRMTIDSVVQKTAISIALVFAAAFATWWWIGDVTENADLGQIGALVTVGAGGAFILSLVNSFKKVISPALVMLFALAEGVALGAVSALFEAQYPGIVMSAVLGTFAAFAGTLAAYKFLNIKVGDKFRKGVVAAMFGFVAVSLLDFVLSFFDAEIGINGFGGIGLVMSVVGLGLGVLMLILDFDFVERGIAAGLPERESWRAAFGLTVTIIWIYIEMLRILAILRGND